jgi:hypothetical protein
LYWTRIDEDGNVVAPSNEPRTYGQYTEEQQELAYDPNVVWVGSFVDAMVHFGIFPDRQNFKAFMFEVNDKGVRKGWDLTYERCLSPNVGDIQFPYLDAEYPPQNGIYRLHNLPGAPGDSADPGELLNSPQPVKGQGDLWGGRNKNEFFKDVKIAIDGTFGLHILRRGDRVRKAWHHPQNGDVREVYALRPLGEGVSHIPTIAGEQPIIV